MTGISDDLRLGNCQRVSLINCSKRLYHADSSFWSLSVARGIEDSRREIKMCFWPLALALLYLASEHEIRFRARSKGDSRLREGLKLKR